MTKREQKNEKIRADIAKLQREIKHQKRLLVVAKANTARMEAEYDATKPRPAIGLLEALRRNIRGEAVAV